MVQKDFMEAHGIDEDIVIELDSDEEDTAVETGQ